MAPETARWLSGDPPTKAPDAKFMGSPWSLNPYQYVEQNPLLYWDPDGRDLSIIWRLLPPFLTGKSPVWSRSSLSTAELRSMTDARGWTNSGMPQEEINRITGSAFEDTLKRGLGFGGKQWLTSPARNAATGGKVNFVVPDGVNDVTTGSFMGRIQTYRNSVFTEVKAVKGTIGLADNDHQLLGLIDVAANSPAGRAHATNPFGAPNAAIFFLTATDTMIGLDVIAEATAKGVVLYKSNFYHITRKDGTEELETGPTYALNPQVLNAARPPLLPPGGDSLGPLVP